MAEFIIRWRCSSGIQAAALRIAGAAMLIPALSAPATAREQPAPFVEPSPAYAAAYEAGDFPAATRSAKAELDECRARVTPPSRACFQLWSALLDSGLLAEDDALVEAEGLSFLAAAEAADGPESEAAGTAVSMLSSLYRRLGRYEEAIAMRARDIAITRKLFGPDHPDLAISLGNEGVLLDYMGRYGEAENRYRQAIAIAEKAGEDSVRLLASQLNNLARTLDNQGQLEESAQVSERVLALQSRLYPPTHPARATTLHNRAIVLRQLGRFDEAETAAREAYAIKLQRLGPDNRETRTSELSLARTLALLGRPQGAEELFASNLRYARGKAPAREKPYSLVAYADFLVDRQRPAEAIPLLNEAIATLGDTGGDPAPIAKARMSMAEALLASGQPDEAEREARRALENFSAGNVQLRLDLQSALAAILAKRGKDAEAIALYRSVLPGYEALLPPAHCQTLALRARLAELLSRDAATRQEALSLLEAASADALTRETIDRFGSPDGLSSGNERCNIAETEIDVIAALRDASQMSRDEASRRGFAAAQRAHRSAAVRARAIAQAAIQTGSDGLAALERERFVLARRIVRDEQRMIEALQEAPDGPAVRHLASNLAEARLRFEALSQRIRADHPDYEAALRPAPLDVAAVQQTLRGDEALLLALPTARGHQMWLITPRGIWWRKSGLSAERFDAALAALTASLRPVADDAMRGQIGTVAAIPPAFDSAAAERLGKDVFGPFARQLAGVRSLRVVQSGPLARLPLALLRWRGGWIADRFRITRLPSVAGLAARGEPGIPAGGIIALGAVASPDAALPRLAGAERQLDDLAFLFGSEALVSKGTAATKRWLVTTPEVASAGVLIFATHSTRMPGPVFEPALQLAATDGAAADDGLLSLSDIGALRLRHPLVVLTACDTATAMPEDPDPLSSFARAFFLARAQSLLVSHWPLDDAAAHVQMRAFFTGLRTDPQADLADALRKSAIALRDDPSGRWRHPRYWAALSYIAGGPAPADSGAKRTDTVSPPQSRSAN